MILLSANAKQDPAVAGVANGVGEEIPENPRQQLGIGLDNRGAGNKVQLQPLGHGHLPEFPCDIVEQVPKIKGGDIRFDHAGIELGNINQGAEQVFNVIQRGTDRPNQAFSLGSERLFQQSTGKQPCCIQRLQQVVADRSEELGFREIGPLGLQLGIPKPGFYGSPFGDFLAQLVVQAGQGRGALLHPSLQVVVGLLQCQGGLAAVGDVPDQHKETDDVSLLIEIRHVGAQHVAHLTLLTCLLEFERHVVAVHDIENLGKQALVKLRRMHLVKTFAKGRLAFAPVP